MINQLTGISEDKNLNFIDSRDLDLYFLYKIAKVLSIKVDSPIYALDDIEELKDRLNKIGKEDENYLIINY